MADEQPIYQPPDEQLTAGEQTVDYMSHMFGWLLTSFNARPWFGLTQMQAMLLDQQVWFGLQLRNAPLIQAKVSVKGPSPEVNRFVQEQWDRFWLRFAPKVLATKYYGYAGFEVTYCEGKRSGLTEIEGLKDFSPLDVRPLVQSKGRWAGRVAGVSVHGQRRTLTGETAKSPTRLFGMKGLWLTHSRLYGSHYGEAATYKAYPAWWDKAMPGGAYDLRRLRGVKDAWIGDVVKYPINHPMTRPDGSIVSGKDIARELAEIRASGGCFYIPSDPFPGTDRPLFEYQPPADVADTSVIRNWLEDCDWDIFDGLLVPREVVEAAESGSGFSGRSIPFVMFLAMGDVELLSYVLSWKEQIAEPLVIRNFGECANDFDMEPEPLLDTMAEKMGGQSMGGPVGGSSQQQGGFHQGSPDDRPSPDAQQPPQFGSSQPARSRPMQFSSTSAPPGARWITIGGDGGEGGTPVLIDAKGNIHAGPKQLTGKNLNSLSSDRDSATSFDPSEWDADDRPPLEPTSRFHQEVLGVAEGYELNANDLKETAEWVWSERRAVNDQREQSKQAARQTTGLTLQDLARIENAGYDHASAHKIGGVTGEKMKHFDAYAQEIARSYPDLGIGDPDNPNEDFAANLWQVIREGRQPTPPKHDREIILEAAELLMKASDYSRENLSLQFATAEDDPKSKQSAVRSGIYRRLDALLKKNGTPMTSGPICSPSKP